ncbi:MAG: hypothetical protein E5X53_28230 [Mesorhizobium sp.]|uniref:hypothetical protein n=1 Tax=Mesorhizobium sp. TaxID=1871066 RepID=UPI001201B369|nr:hypothetical protein [Mesorhizobium sp.]TIP70347.1 MAG: hypothetical protein E5X55_27920 [Mesorhizobium sp.]TIQ06744.1 MAG: hypothetical protein E5X57_24140 [Mesorhizobium sp.]TIR48615.1 MAG: hypothetical protein E5X53_28230 [Mesorhizobium sp.]TJV94696.1 MAG: hypothetical protein E5X52_27905 [Mesorhizobium sp.]
MSVLLILTATAVISFLGGVAVERALAGARITKRQAQIDHMRFMLAPTIPHSLEDVARRAGC